jgi:TetR/AcrR family transcriptional regulator, transcriptional repressor for nem operon
MRRSRTETAESRRRILTVAARLFREKGIEQVSVGEIMSAADMTHGGFYVHFKSKDDLVGAAVQEAFNEVFAGFFAEDDSGKRQSASGYVDAYLTAKHAANLCVGCPIAGLTTGVVHAAPNARRELALGAAKLISMLAEDFFAGNEQKAMQLLSQMVGTIILERALAGTIAEGTAVRATRLAPDVANLLPRAA